MSIVLVFGAFDPLHAGHAHFLGRARAHGDRLVVALATDDAIRALKSHEPHAPFAERKAALQLLPIVDDVLTSDASGTFMVLEEVQPDTIALGYDQDALRNALKTWMITHHEIPIIQIDAHEPEKFKSSKLI